MMHTFTKKPHRHYAKRAVHCIGRAIWQSLETYGWAISVGYGAVTPPPWQHDDKPGEAL
jgi:hypothetical protein